MMNGRAKKFRQTISSIKTTGEFNTSSLTSDESTKRMNDRIQKNIDKNQETINRGMKNLNNERYKVMSEIEQDI